MSALGHEVRARGVRGTSVADETGCAIESDHLMPQLGEVTRDATFATADLERSPATRRKHQLKERVTVEPVRVEAGRPRPSKPVLCLLIPLTHLDVLLRERGAAEHGA